MWAVGGAVVGGLAAYLLCRRSGSTSGVGAVGAADVRRWERIDVDEWNDLKGACNVTEVASFEECDLPYHDAWSQWYCYRGRKGYLVAVSEMLGEPAYWVKR